MYSKVTAHPLNSMFSHRPEATTLNREANFVDAELESARSTDVFLAGRAPYVGRHYDKYAAHRLEGARYC